MPRHLCSVICVSVLLLAAADLSAQSLMLEVTGVNAGDRTGTVVAWGEMHSTSPTGQCTATNYVAAGAPGWSSDTGRLELWDTSTLSPFVAHTLIGGQPIDEYACSFITGANVVPGSFDYVIGIRRHNGGQGRVEARTTGACASQPIALVWAVPGATASEEFGHVVVGLDDLNGDGYQEVLVGAPERDTWSGPGFPIAEAGAFYVLDGSTGATLRSAVGNAPDGHLGWSAANLGDLNGDGYSEYAVGEPGAAGPNPAGGTFTDAGRLRVYSGIDGARLMARESTGPSSYAAYGTAVAACGDVNRDGVPDHVVGAPEHSLGTVLIMPHAGLAQVRSGVDGSLLLQMTGVGAYSNFGAAVAGGVDLLKDGFPEILVGAPGYDSGRGRAQLWSMRTQSLVYDVAGAAGDELGAFVGMADVGDGFWTVGTPGRLGDKGGFRIYSGLPSWIIKGTSPSYGASVALLGDVDGDGWDDFAASQYDSGAAFVAPVWDIRSGKTSAILHHFDNMALHGNTVAGIGDVNGDGTLDLAQAMPEEGIVHIRSGASPTQVIRTHSSISGAAFGRAMSDAGDVDGDGTSDYLVGEPEWDNLSASPARMNVGRVHVFSGFTGNLIRIHTGWDEFGKIGFSLASLGDVDGDGRDDYGSGAPYADLLALNIAPSGRAYVWSGASGSSLWNLFGIYNSNMVGSRLGFSMCGPGDVDGDGYADFAVGEPFYDGYGIRIDGRVRVIKGGPAGSAFPVIHHLLCPGPGASTTTNYYAGWALEAVGDVDRDGVCDIAFSWPWLLSAPGGVSVHSGATGGELFYRNAHNTHWPANWSGLYGQVMAGRRGPHADMRQELIVGVPTLASMSQPGGVDVILLPEAGAADLGTGCGSNGPSQPLLQMTTPVLGQLTQLSVQALPGTAGAATVMVSVPTSSAIPLGSGCNAYLDMGTLNTLLTLPGSGSLTLLLPESAAFAGFSFNAQAFALDSSAPLGLVLTNGLTITLGF